MKQSELELIFETAIKKSLEYLALESSKLKEELDKSKCDKYALRIIYSLSETKKEKTMYWKYYQGKKK